MDKSSSRQYYKEYNLVNRGFHKLVSVGTAGLKNQLMLGFLQEKSSSVSANNTSARSTPLHAANFSWRNSLPVQKLKMASTTDFERTRTFGGEKRVWISRDFFFSWGFWGFFLSRSASYFTHFFLPWVVPAEKFAVCQLCCKRAFVETENHTETWATTSSHKKTAYTGDTFSYLSHDLEKVGESRETVFCFVLHHLPDLNLACWKYHKFCKDKNYLCWKANFSKSLLHRNRTSRTDKILALGNILTQIKHLNHSLLLITLQNYVASDS